MQRRSTSSTLFGVSVVASLTACAARPPTTAQRASLANADSQAQPRARPWAPLEPASPFILSATPTAVLLQGPAAVSRESLAEFSPDGSVFATLERGAVQIRDASTGQLRAEAHGPALGIAWSPSGQKLAIAAQNGVLVWDMTSGESTYTVQPGDVSAHHEKPCSSSPCARFSPNGEQLLIPGEQAVALWDLKHSKLQKQISAKSRASQSQWSPSGSQFTVLHDDDGSLQIHDGKTGELRRTLTAPVEVGKMTASAFAPQGNSIAVGGRLGRVAVVDSATDRVLVVSPELKGTISALAWHPTSKMLAIGLSTGDKASTYLWSMDASLPQPVNDIERRAGSPISWDVTALTWNAAGTSLAVFDVFPLVDESFKAAVVDPVTRKVVRITEGASELGALSPDFARLLQIKTKKDDLTLVELASRKTIFSLPQRPRSWDGWAFNPETAQLQLGEFRFDFRRATAQRAPGEAPNADFPRTTDQEKFRFEGFALHSPLSRDGTRAVASEDLAQSAHCYFDVTARACVARLAQGMNSGAPWVFSPSGRWLGAATGQTTSEDAYVALFDAKTAKPIARLASGTYRGFYWLSDQIVLETLDDTMSFRLIRWADGRSIDGYLIDETPNSKVPHDVGTLLVRDDGKFDGSKAAFKWALLRSDANIKNAPLVALMSVANQYRREGMLKEFLSGK